jgi:hypothetical protein
MGVCLVAEELAGGVRNYPAALPLAGLPAVGACDRDPSVGAAVLLGTEHFFALDVSGAL